MFRFLRTLFTKPAPPPAPGSSPEHRYCPDFSSLEASGFEAVDESRYHTRVEDGAFVLELKKPSLFAWADDGTFRYADVSIEAEIDFSDDDQEQASPQQASPLRASPLRAAGLLLRKAAESSFVYALISSEADVRLDMVFNGEPRTLIPWTACPWARGASRFVLSVVARGSHFVVMVNGRFALEAEDDSLASGGIAFAAQSYSEPAVFRLVSYRVESRPVEVEADYLRYARIIEADADQRRRLAEGLFSLGYFVAALVQLQKIADRGAETANDAFLKAECLLRLDMPGEAAQAIEECLDLDPTKEEAIEERYNVMYLCGEYSRLKEALESDAARVAGSPRLANLLGHAYYNGGSWAKAASSYGVAARGEPTMPIYSRNYARALEKAGQPSDASAAWLAAARGFYEQGAWDDALECSARLRELGYDKVTLDSLEAMIDYGGGEPAKAEPVLARLFRKGLADAPASYVYGLILARRGKRTEAIKAFRQAASLEPERPLYRYRLAESLFMAGEPYQAELDAAIEAAPDDGWTLNLAGQAAMRRGDADKASTMFARAVAALPGEVAVAINYADSLCSRGSHDEAVMALGDWPDTSAAASNALGNVLALMRELDRATSAYRHAVDLAGDSSEVVDYLVNLGAVLVEQGDMSEAEEALRKALERRSDARALMLMGDLATEYGDTGRAELAYRAALEDTPEDAAILGRIVNHYVMRRKFDKAERHLPALDRTDPKAAAAARARIRDATIETIACASCGLSWDVPKPTPAAPRATLRGEPPDSSPAGSCPSCGSVYCVACRKEHLVDGRFTCPVCGTRLNLNDNRIRWLVYEAVRNQSSLQEPGKHSR